MNFTFNNLPGLAGLAPLLIGLWWVMLIVIHVSFSAAIVVDASRINQVRGYTTFVSPIIWSLAVWAGGVLAVLAYWLIHHSALNPKKTALDCT